MRAKILNKLSLFGMTFSALLGSNKLRNYIKDTYNNYKTEEGILYYVYDHDSENEYSVKIEKNEKHSELKNFTTYFYKNILTPFGYFEYLRLKEKNKQTLYFKLGGKDDLKSNVASQVFSDQYAKFLNKHNLEMMMNL